MTSLAHSDARRGGDGKGSVGPRCRTHASQGGLREQVGQCVLALVRLKPLGDLGRDQRCRSHAMSGTREVAGVGGEVDELVVNGREASLR